MADTSRSDVDAVYGDRAMSDSDADTHVGIANRLVDDTFGGQVRTQGEIEGNEKDFKTYVAAALWAVREGESNSESQAGGSITYNFNNPSEMKSWLANLNRFGATAAGYIRDSASFGVEIA